MIEEKARSTYRELLAFLRETGRQKKMWFALPSQIDEWWRARRGMRIVGEEGHWRVVGKARSEPKLPWLELMGTDCSTHSKAKLGKLKKSDVQNEYQA